MDLIAVLAWAGMAAIAALALGAYAAISRPGAVLSREYAQRRDSLVAATPLSSAALAASPELQLVDIANLPPPVQRYLQVSGALGKPRVRSVELTFDAEMFSKPGQPGMRGVAKQLDVIDPARRLFFMQTRMKGLPVAVFHDYTGRDASMRVRLVSLFDVVNQHGDALARVETVTFLNDLCLFVPSALVDPRFVWQAIDDKHAQVQFTNGPHTVSATLIFDANGDLVNFISEDRTMLEPDGAMRPCRWSTPMRGHRDFDGHRLPAEGAAIWHLPAGDFVYGRFILQQAHFDWSHNPRMCSPMRQSGGRASSRR